MLVNPRSTKVLIIDDEERNRKLLEVLVQADGHATLLAADGDAGVALAVSAQPDIVLLDLMMPGTDGFEVVQRLKRNPATQCLPIIVVTALDDVASRRRVLASGADEFIGKPVDRWELSLRISRLLKLRHS